MDVFRILVGVLAAGHFVRLLIEHSQISAPDGLIDHALVQEIYWYTRVGLFHPGMPGWLFLIAYALGLAGALLVVLGHRVCQRRSQRSQLWRLKMSHPAGGDEPQIVAASRRLRVRLG